MKNGKYDKETVLASAARTTSGNSNSVETQFFRELIAFLNVTVISGTTPTLDVKFQDSQNGTDWIDVPSGAFAQITTTTGLRRLVLPAVGPYVRAVYTIAGTTPSYTFDLVLTGKN